MGQKVYYNGVYGEQSIKLVRDIINIIPFKKLVQENNSIKKKVEDYASELGISVASLSQICKTISGKTPKEVILDFLILNIKSTLKNMEYSMSEVSYQCDIDDPSYIARLFKHKTGQTPKQYRADYN